MKTQITRDTFLHEVRQTAIYKVLRSFSLVLGSQSFDYGSDADYYRGAQQATYSLLAALDQWDDVAYRAMSRSAKEHVYKLLAAKSPYICFPDFRGCLEVPAGFYESATYANVMSRYKTEAHMDEIEQPIEPVPTAK